MRNTTEVVILADVNNLYHGSMKKYGARLDYKKFYAHLKKEHGGIRLAYAYGSGSDEGIESFKALLRHSGFETRWNETKYNWNVSIAIDAVRQLDRVDLVILGSGDPFLAPAAEFIRQDGLKCYSYGFRISQAMKKSCDRWFEIPEALLINEDRRRN